MKRRIFKFIDMASYVAIGVAVGHEYSTAAGFFAFVCLAELGGIGWKLLELLERPCP